MSLLVPLYKDFRAGADKLMASFSNKEVETLEAYFLKATEIMNATTNKLNKK